MTRRRTFPAAAALASFAATAPLAAFAQDDGAPVVNFYGQLNFGIFSTDDGVRNETYFTDNDNSNSRVGVTYDTALKNGGKFKLQFETALGFKGSGSVTLDDTDLDLDWRRTDLRKFEAVYTTPSAGTFSFGQGSTATDGIAEADFSGTTVVMYSGLPDLAGSVEFNTTAGVGTGVTVGNAFSNLDGARRFRLRYDTPDFNGFSFAASAGEEVLVKNVDTRFYDVGLRYNRDYEAYKVSANIGYGWTDDDREVVSGSIAFIHTATGLNAALSGGERKETDADYLYFKLGILRDDLLTIGQTAFSIDWYDGNDFDVTGSDSTSFGIGVVQRIHRYKTELYAGYREYSYETPSVTTSDIQVAVLGARWKF